MAAADPFLVVKDEVAQSFKGVRALYQRWEELLGDRRADKEEFEWTTNELRTNLKSIGWDLEDLAETVSIVKADPQKFKLSLEEVKAREDFIQRHNTELKELLEKTSEARVKGQKTEKDKKSLMGKGKYSRYERLEQEIQDSNQGFIDDQQQSQTMIMREQDSQLEEVGQTIGNLRHMGEMINDELESQNDLLDEMDTEMNTTQERLLAVMRKVDKTLAISRDGKQSCCICLLIIIVLALMLVYLTK